MKVNSDVRKERWRIYDELLEVMHSFFLRPKLWVSPTVSSAETFFRSLLLSMDIANNGDGSLNKKFKNFDEYNSNTSLSLQMNFEEAMNIFRKFHDTHIIVKLSPTSLSNDKEKTKFLGSFPVRKELEILSADEASNLELGFYIQEYLGCKIYLWGKDNKPWPHTLRKRDALKVGDKICLHWNAKSWSHEIVEDDDGKLIGENKDNIANLSFSSDERKCWTAFCFINRSG